MLGILFGDLYSEKKHSEERLKIIKSFFAPLLATAASLPPFFAEAEGIFALTCDSQTKINHLKELAKKYENDDSGQIKDLSAQIIDFLKPSYVANIPVTVESDSEGDTTDGDDYAGAISLPPYPVAYFEAPHKHFRLMPEKKNHSARGSVDSKDVAKSTDVPIKEGAGIFERSVALTTMLTQESFGAGAGESSIEAKARLAVCFGLNKMRSLSNSRNRALPKALAEALPDSISAKKFGFYWDGIWEFSRDGETWVPSSYSLAKRFYRQLKKHDKVHGSAQAKAFLSAIERPRAHLVPYRDIREKIKDHDATKALVTEQRTKRPRSEVYLGVFDSDMQAMRDPKRKRGAMSGYDDMIAASVIPLHIASSGYRIDNTNLMLAFAVECDMLVRQKTAEIIKLGVYYTEPSAIIRILPGCKTVTEKYNFAKSEQHYQSPKEMPLLMANVVKSRKIDPQKTAIFETRAQITTTIPVRMEEEFTAKVNGMGKIIHWGLSDFKTMRQVSQTHYDPLSFATSVAGAFNLAPITQIKIADGQVIKLNKKATSDLLESLISRVFNAYEPIELAREYLNENPGQSFQGAVNIVLKDYSRFAGLLNAKAGIGRDYVNKDAQLGMEHADSLDDIIAVTELIRSILSQESSNKLTADHILEAAKNCGAALSDLFKAKLELNGSENAIGQLFSLENKMLAITGIPVPTVAITLNGIYQRVVENNVLNDKDGFKREALNDIRALKDDLRAGPHGTYPLHWAAITGNQNLVDKLLDHNQSRAIAWVADKYKQTEQYILPLHCVIYYSAKNEVNLDLIERLCDEKVLQLAGNGKTVFRLILKVCPQPLSIIGFFIKNYTSLLAEAFTAEFYVGFDLISLIIDAITENELDVANFLAERFHNTEELQERIKQRLLDKARPFNSRLKAWANVRYPALFVEIDYPEVKTIEWVTALVVPPVVVDVEITDEEKVAHDIAIQIISTLLDEGNKGLADSIIADYQERRDIIILVEKAILQFIFDRAREPNASLVGWAIEQNYDLDDVLAKLDEETSFKFARRFGLENPGAEEYALTL